MSRSASRLLLALCLPACLGLAPRPSRAHDTWVQTNVHVVRTGDLVHVDLMLGNHGNEHRDFKLAGKTSLEGATLQVVLPDGTRFDLLSSLADVGYAPKEGFWTSPFVGAKPGLYVVSHTLDKVVNHGHPVRSIKSAKTLFVHSPSLDRIPVDQTGYDRVLGHPLELVPATNPVVPMGPGTPITVRLLHKGKPLAGERVSFIPRGTALKEGFDSEHERTTDADGRASFTPRAGNYYLVVAHKLAADEKGDGYDETKYSATLTVYVPQICPCCNE